jgi:hypothetical protein
MSQLIYPFQPTYTDILNSDLVQDKPLTQDLLLKLHHNAMYATVRCEVFDCGFYTHGQTITTPISWVDGYTYSLGEMIYIPLLASTRQPATYDWQNINTSPTGLLRDATGLTWVYLSADLATPLTVGLPFWIAGSSDDNVAVPVTYPSGFTNSSFDGLHFVASVTSQSVFSFQQAASLGADTGGGGSCYAAFRPGQALFPALANQDAGHGNLQAAPYQLSVSSGVLTSEVYLGKTGVTGQCTVRIIGVGQRDLGSLTFGDGAPTFVDSIGGKSLESLLLGGSPLTQSLIRAIAANARFGAVRLEVFDGGYYANNDTVGLPTSLVDSYAYSRNECLYMPILASSMSPTGYTPGQLTFPSLDSSTLIGDELLESPQVLRITNPTGKITQQVYYRNQGMKNWGTIHAFVIAQRSSLQSQA